MYLVILKCARKVMLLWPVYSLARSKASHQWPLIKALLIASAEPWLTIVWRPCGLGEEDLWVARRWLSALCERLRAVMVPLCGSGRNRGATRGLMSRWLVRKIGGHSRASVLPQVFRTQRAFIPPASRMKSHLPDLGRVVVGSRLKWESRRSVWAAAQCAEGQDNT